MYPLMIAGSLSSASVCVVKVDGVPYLCKTDEVGEICVSSVATGTAYYGLLGITKNVFEVCILFLIFLWSQECCWAPVQGGMEACEGLLGPSNSQAPEASTASASKEALIDLSSAHSTALFMTSPVRTGDTRGWGGVLWVVNPFRSAVRVRKWSVEGQVPCGTLSPGPQALCGI